MKNCSVFKKVLNQGNKEHTALLKSKKPMFLFILEKMRT